MGRVPPTPAPLPDVPLRWSAEDERSAALLSRTSGVLFMWTLSPDARSAVWVSPGFTELTGHSPQEVLADPRRFLDLVHPDDRAQFDGGLPSMAASPMVFRVVRPGAEPRWVRSQVVSTGDGAPGSLGWVGAVEDVSDPVHALSHNDRLASVAVAATTALSEADDADLDRTLVAGLRQLAAELDSPAAILFQMDPGGVLAEPHQWFAAPLAPLLAQPAAADDHASSTQWLSALADVGAVVVAFDDLPPTAVHARALASVGGMHSVAVVPAVQRDGSVVALAVGSSRTPGQWPDQDLRVLELFARAARSAAERAAAQRRSRESVAALLAANEAAERASAAKSRFLARAGHELRSPLAALSTLLQLLELTPLDDDQSTMVADARGMLAQQLAVVDDLAEVSRSEVVPRGTCASFDLVELCRDELGVVAPLARARGLHVDLLAPVDLTVSADRVLVRQVVSNLVSNAVKYVAAAGSVTVAVRDTGSAALVEVADSGPGPDPALVERMFVPFERLVEGPDAPPGTGLGLAIARHAADSLGASVRADVAPAATTFTFTLPHDRGPLGPGTDASLLLVDDSDTWLSVLERAMRQVGRYRDVRRASTADAALALATERLPDLVVLDLHLSEGDGVDLLHRLRRLPGAEHLPVMVVTADPGESSRRRSLESGVDAYFVKTPPLRDLVDAVDALVAAPR